MSDRPQTEENEQRTESACGTPGCCGDIVGSTAMDRRSFIQVAGSGIGAGALAVSGLGSLAAFAGPFTPQETIDHFVPTDKKLSPEWVDALFAKGNPVWCRGVELETIGMPVGGICSGQVYLAGDGRLIFIDIFNQYANSGYGRVNYKEGRSAVEMVVNTGDMVQAPAIDQGFALAIEIGGERIVRSLDARGFAGVRFCGEYPIGLIEFTDNEVPLDVRLKAFSPFIPLSTGDSALPATVLTYSLKNLAAEPVRVTLAGWLENEVCHHTAREAGVTAWRSNREVRGDGMTAIVGDARLEEDPLPPDYRPPIVLCDFEGGGYGDWTVEGEAFGNAPATGTLANQQVVTGFQGEGLVNTFVDGDSTVGKLTSPEFFVERPWISFLIGGGAQPELACINLVVDGLVVRTATGRNDERLVPHNWNVEDLAGRTARIEIIDATAGGWGHINVDQIELRDAPMQPDLGDLSRRPDIGTMALAVLGPGPVLSSARLPADPMPGALFAEEGLRTAVAQGASASVAPRSTGDAVTGDVETRRVAATNEPLRGAVGRTVELDPGETADVTFVLSWHMPNLYFRDSWVGNRYTVRFADAAEVASYVAANHDRLVRETQLWHDTWYDSTLPWWLLFRVHSTVANLATTTCQWWKSGRFWAYEGCGCCHGTCGHVWNYAHAVARLFPELERSAREMQDFAAGVGFIPETGEIRFRGEGWSIWAGDSQGGYILKAWREHLCSADDAFLRRNWPQIKKALEFLIVQDADSDGILEGMQHQTYDENYYGANTMVGSLYLGALRAGEEMAGEMGDADFAATCRAIFEAGSRASVERLFNGEYYIQEVDLERHPDWQYGDGCLADQMFGQGWAHQLGLGYLYPAETVRQALGSVWKYCWAPDVELQNQHHSPERWFAYPGEAGLFTCTWPKSLHMGPRSTRYRNEVWTGIEYQVANHMAAEGMLTESLAICRAIDERYHPGKRNPFNEIECGDHYARALASWGMLISLSGFEYHGPRRRLGFAPRITPEEFKAAFTGAEGWGSLAQKRSARRQTNTLTVAWGKVPLSELALSLQPGLRAVSVRAFKLTVLGPRGEATQEELALEGFTQEGQLLTIRLPDGLVLGPGETLRVEIES